VYITKLTQKIIQKGDPMDLETYKKYAFDLVTRGYIPIDGDISDVMTDIFKECLLLTIGLPKRDRYTILIDSDGGSNEALASMKGAMVTSKLIFDGVVIGRANSAAFRLLQYCKVRKATPGASLIMHWGDRTLTNSELGSIARQRTWAIDRIFEQQMEMITEIQDRTGIPIEELFKFADDVRSFSAKKAKELNMIDEILETPLDTNKADT
jgi:ATP-dependent protease ClpP protease subunit